MHKKFVINVIARLLLISSFALFLPLAWAYHDNPQSSEVLGFVKTIILGLVVSISAILLTRVPKKLKKKQTINTKDGLAIVSLSWIVLSLWGALPFYFAGVVFSYTDAFFEVVSGFTTTGATVFTDIEALPRGILFWRSLTHWLGGMGIIVLYIAVLPFLGVNTFQLYKAEAPGLTVERVAPRLKETARNLWSIYVGLSGLLTVLLVIGGMSVFDALCHTFATMATGGFSTSNTSVMYMNPFIQWTLIVFMFLAGCNFILHYQCLHRRPKAYFRNEEFRVYFFIVIFLTPLFAFFLKNGHLSDSPFRDSMFQIIAIMTTTGFVSADFNVWPPFLQMALVILMICGACGGSTGGGMKLIRVYLTLKSVIRSVFQANMPNAIFSVKFNQKPLTERLVSTLLAYFAIYFNLLIFGAAFFILLESCDILTGITAVISALSNIGPGLNAVGPVENYGWISAQGKLLLCFLMLAGRLEFYSILILFLPVTWRK